MEQVHLASWTSSPHAWTRRRLNSSYRENIMASAIVPLVLQGLFAVLIKQADCDWATSLGVWVFSMYVTLLSLGCACVSVSGGRTPEAAHWSQSSTGVSTHATDPVTLTSIMTAGLIPREWPGAQGEEMRRSVVRRATQQGHGCTMCCSSYSSM